MPVPRVLKPETHHFLVGGSSPVTLRQILAASRRDASVASAPRPALRPVHSALRRDGMCGISTKDARAGSSETTGRPTPRSGGGTALGLGRYAVAKYAHLASLVPKIDVVAEQVEPEADPRPASRPADDPDPPQSRSHARHPQSACAISDSRSGTCRSQTAPRYLGAHVRASPDVDRENAKRCSFDRRVRPVTLPLASRPGRLRTSRIS